MAWYTYIAMGGGIFALRRPRPYSRHCGEIVGGITTPAPHLCPADNNGNGMEADNDAARRVATSSEKRENRF